jgi:hypothetical protein
VGVFFVSIMILTIYETVMASVDGCREMTVDQWKTQEVAWQGREVVAFASWCSSCKDKLSEARANPQAYILLSVFDDAASSEHVLRKLQIAAECIRGDALVEYLDIRSLPWHRRIAGK